MTAITKSFVSIADTSVDADSPVDSQLMTGLRDDVQHLREWLGASYYAGAVQNHNHDGSNSAVIVHGAFDTSSTATTQSVGNNSTAIATTAFCENGFVNNDIGYEGIGIIAFMNNQSGASLATNATAAGTALYTITNDASGIMVVVTGASPGTWKNICNYTIATGAMSTSQSCGILQRIY